MKVNEGDVLVCVNPKIERNNWVVAEIEDWHVTLVDADKLYNKNKGLGDLWRVNVAFLDMNFMQL